MLRYTKRLVCKLRFWWKEMKIEMQEENSEDLAASGRNTMAGYEDYKAMKAAQRAERLKKHKEELDAIK